MSFSAIVPQQLLPLIELPSPFFSFVVVNFPLRMYHSAWVILAGSIFWRQPQFA